MSLSTNVSDLATRIATEVKAIRTLVNGNVSALSSLTTTDKTNLVSAINELNTLISNIDLTAIIDDTNISTSTTFSSSEITGWFGSGISDMAGSTVADKLSAISANLGILNNLTTDEKMSAVGAINELQTEINNLQTEINNLQTELDNIDFSALAGPGLIYIPETNTLNVRIGDTFGGLKIEEGYLVAKTDNVSVATDENGKLVVSTDTLSPVASKTYVDDAVAALVDGAPELLDTLNELAAAINDDASFATTITNSIATKADDSAVVKLTGDQSIDGVKTFTSAPVVPDSAFAIAKITGLQAALDAKASAANVGDTTTNYVTVFEAGLV